MVTDYKVLSENFSSVRFVRNEKPWQPTEELSAYIESVWQKQLDEAKAKGRDLHNGSMARVESYSVEDGVLTLKIQPTDYRHFVGSRDMLEASGCAHPLSVGGLTVTKDNYMVTGRKGKSNELGAGQVHIAPSGYVAWEDLAGGGTGFASALLRELNEELGVSPARPIALIDKQDIRQPILAAEVRLPYNRKEVLESWKALKKKEFDELLFVEADPSALLSFLNEREKELRAHARGALACYAKKLAEEGND